MRWPLCGNPSSYICPGVVSFGDGWQCVYPLRWEVTAGWSGSSLGQKGLPKTSRTWISEYPGKIPSKWTQVKLVDLKEDKRKNMEEIQIIHSKSIISLETPGDPSSCGQATSLLSIQRHSWQSLSGKVERIGVGSAPSSCSDLSLEVTWCDAVSSPGDILYAPLDY